MNSRENLKASTKEEKREEKRRQIIRTAAKDFADLGFDKANINVIAEKAGIGKGTIYLYFSSKEELLVAALEESVRLLQQVSLKALKDKKDAMSKLVALCNSCCATYAEDYEDFFKLVISVLYGSNQEFKAIAMSALSEYLSMVEHIITEGIEQKLFRPIDVKMVTMLIFGVAEAYYISQSAPCCADKETVRGCMPTVLDFIMDGIRYRG